jgi:Na+/glutamate symporter
MISFLSNIWGCMPELSKDCIDMSNASSTYIGIVAGAIIGGIVSWWIYNRQKQTSEEQDRILGRIKDLEENHTNILKKLEDFDDKHENSFDAIQEINKKIDMLSRKQEEESSK